MSYYAQLLIVILICVGLLLCLGLAVRGWIRMYDANQENKEKQSWQDILQDKIDRSKK